jgi:hypothetical protein
MKPRAILLLTLCAAWAVSPVASRAQSDLSREAADLISGLDLEQAGRVLAAADPSDSQATLQRARLAVYDLDCDAAVSILGRIDLQRGDASTLADVARGCQRATAALSTTRDGGLGIEVQWQDEHDLPLAPLVFETVARARDALTRDLGVDWPRPTRIVVVRDAMSLSAMTGLPYASAQTTGTVAVAKWGRVTLLSPRASPHGFPWRDTLAHELTHLAVTRISRDRAPLWLQEGVAKYEEVRWREPAPFDDRPPPDRLVVGGMKLGLGLPLDRLGPSIAMLPSAEAATVAFAEVTSFVDFYVRTQPAGALSRLLRALRDAPDTKAALIAASGSDLEVWNDRWRAFLSNVPADASFIELGGTARAKPFWRELRDRSRLAELLDARNHEVAAIKELDRYRVSGDAALRDAASGDPSIRWLRGRSEEGSGLDLRSSEFASLFEDPKEVRSSFAPWWALRGRWARARGEEAIAVDSFGQAVAADPFDPEGTCEVVAGDPSADANPALCASARAWSGSPNGGVGGD